MTQTERISSELRRSLLGPAWHGDSLLELITGLSPERAAAKPIPGVHSIHEIVLHLTHWVQMASMALHGQCLPEWPFDADWPEANGTPWHRAVGNLRLATEELAVYTERLPEARLEEQTAGRYYSNGVLLLGVVQHAAYHGGQIALLKKLARV